MEETMSILTIDHISKYYDLDGTNQERALNDVTPVSYTHLEL